MKSMTGYGRGEFDNGIIKMTVEIKAVNNRYCEVIIKQPRQYMALEDKIKKYIISNIERGRVEVFINTKELSSENSEIKINHQQALCIIRSGWHLPMPIGTRIKRVMPLSGSL